jgi:hypothetical protein
MFHIISCDSNILQLFDILKTSFSTLIDMNSILIWKCGKFQSNLGLKVISTQYFDFVVNIKVNVKFDTIKRGETQFDYLQLIFHY